MRVMFLIVFALAFIPLAYGVTCGVCGIGRCECYVEECSSGIIDVYDYSARGCKGLPIVEKVFSRRSFEWSPEKGGTYYVKVFCDDGNVSGCTTLAVESRPPTAPPTTPPTTPQPVCGNGECEEGEDCCNCEADCGCKKNEYCDPEVCMCRPKPKKRVPYATIVIAIFALAIFALVLIKYFGILPKGISWEELYSKWR